MLLCSSHDPSRAAAGADALAVLTELEAQDAALFARKQQALYDTYSCFDARPIGPDYDGRGSVQFLALEVAIACGIAQSTATARINKALHFVENLPGTLRMLHEQTLTVGQALVLHDETHGLPTDTCAALEDAVLHQAVDCSTGDTRRRVKKALLALDVANSEQRRRQRAQERKTFLSPKPDGRAFIGIEGSAQDGSRFFAELTLLCQLTYGTDDPRTLDQQRSDLALALSGFGLASRHGHGPTLRHHLGLADDGQTVECTHSKRNTLSPAQQRRVQAVILVLVETGLAMSDDPAELIGYGPISGPHARELLAAAELRHATSELTTGRILSLSDEVLRPPIGWYWPTTALPRRTTLEHDTRHGPPRHGPPPPDRPGRSRRRRGGATRARPAPQGAPARSGPPASGPLSVTDALLGMIHRPQPALLDPEPQHDPSPLLADLLRFRDTRCIGPGCSLPAHLCDLEHWQPHPAGPTSAFNCGPASRRCHNAKTHGGWDYTPHPDGSITWTSAHGTTYLKAPRTSGHQLHALHPPRPEPPPHQRREP